MCCSLFIFPHIDAFSMKRAQLLKFEIWKIPCGALWFVWYDDIIVFCGQKTQGLFALLFLSGSSSWVKLDILWWILSRLTMKLSQNIKWTIANSCGWQHLKCSLSLKMWCNDNNDRFIWNSDRMKLKWNFDNMWLVSGLSWAESDKRCIRLQIYHNYLPTYKIQFGRWWWVTQFRFLESEVTTYNSKHLNFNSTTD